MSLIKQILGLNGNKDTQMVGGGRKRWHPKIVADTSVAESGLPGLLPSFPSKEAGVS